MDGHATGAGRPPDGGSQKAVHERADHPAVHDAHVIAVARQDIERLRCALGRERLKEWAIVLGEGPPPAARDKTVRRRRNFGILIVPPGIGRAAHRLSVEISATTRPLGPSAKRTMTSSPGCRSSSPLRRRVSMWTKMSPDEPSRITNP